jgi:hypothetical protein
MQTLNLYTGHPNSALRRGGVYPLPRVGVKPTPTWASPQFGKKFKSEPQNARLPCEALCSVTVAVTLIGMANLLEISLRA